LEDFSMTKIDSLNVRLGQLRHEARRQGMVGLERDLSWAACGAPESQVQALILSAERRLRMDCVHVAARKMIGELNDAGHLYTAGRLAEVVRAGDRRAISKAIGYFQSQLTGKE
jgi:hypothetical protein